jgi:hypothetical protein
LIQRKEKQRESDKSRSSGKAGLEAQDRGKLKEVHLNNGKSGSIVKWMYTREISRTMQMNMKQAKVKRKLRGRCRILH